MRLLRVLGPCYLVILKLILVMKLLLRRYLKVCHDGYSFTVLLLMINMLHNSHGLLNVPLSHGG